MILNNVLDIVDSRISDLKEGDIVVDATLGNGKDAYKLLKRIGKEGRLYGFDIQEEAIENTRENLKDFSGYNYELILDSHENFDKYIDEEVDLVIYNLGYLPGGNKEITTNYNSTIVSLEKALNIIKRYGKILIVVYHGHENGKKEKLYVEEFLKSINQKDYNVLKEEFINQKNNPPILYEIHKK